MGRTTISDEQIRQTVDTFDRRAERYRDLFLRHEPYLRTFDELARRMTPGHRRLLDLACGPGTASAYLKEHHPHLHVTGADLSESMLALAAELVPSGTWIRGDLRDAAHLDGPFDVIVCAFGIPYLGEHAARQFVVDCGQLLAPRGLVYLSFIECDGHPHEQTNAMGDSVWRQGHTVDDVHEYLALAGLEPQWSHATPMRGETEHFVIAVAP